MQSLASTKSTLWFSSILFGALESNQEYKKSFYLLCKLFASYLLIYISIIIFNKITLQVLETELAAHEAAVVTIGKEARELIIMGHHASQTIYERNATL